MADRRLRLPPSPGRQLGLLWGGVSLALILLSPLASRAAAAGGLPACPFKALTGWPCPACGTTRAAVALAAFEPLEALVRYPLPTLGWTVLVGGGLVAGFLALRRRPLPGLPRRVPLWVRLGMVAAILVNWIYAVATGV